MKKQYAIYRDVEAASWQNMCVGHRYEIIDIDIPKGGIPWYKTYCGKRNGGKTRWTSSACFDDIVGMGSSLRLTLVANLSRFKGA